MDGLKKLFIKDKQPKATESPPASTPVGSRRLGSIAERASARASGRRMPAQGGSARPTTGDPRIAQIIDESLRSGKKHGFKELEEQLEVLSELPEEQRLKLAVKTAGAAHDLELPDFVAAVEERIQILNDEKTVFESEIVTEVEQIVHGKEQELQAKEAQIEQIDAQILQLQEQRHETEVAMEAVRREISDVTEDSRSQTQAFTSVYMSRMEELTSLLTRLQALPS